MLSILIPVYNYNITAFVRDLASQCAAENALQYEILCYDDCSTDKNLHQINSAVNQLPYCTYQVLDKNIGRSKIRNLLADRAKGDILLFLDCDGKPCSKDFIHTYINNTDGVDVICGGTKYQDKTAINSEYLLHWKNGKAREEGKKHFTTNNFLIRKEIFKKLRFDETLTGYGHEDTVFGEQLKQNGYRIIHIDNPVYHLGLKKTDKFIADTQNAERNLKKLYGKEQYTSAVSDLTIVKAYKKLEKLHLTKMYSRIIEPLSPLILKNLHSACPNLRLLDLYKLNLFIKE